MDMVKIHIGAVEEIVLKNLKDDLLPVLQRPVLIGKGLPEPDLADEGQKIL